tara:strand:+ start:127 stop:1788 length:1662 start_codon:yes stop_codon:yes gene_type:complete
MNPAELYTQLATQQPKRETPVVEPEDNFVLPELDEAQQKELGDYIQQAYSMYEGLPTAQQFIADVAPGTGEAISAYEAKKFGEETKEAFQEGKYGEAALKAGLTGLSALGAIPIVGAAARVPKAAVKTVAKKILKGKKGVKAGMSQVDESKLVKDKFNYSKQRILGGESRLYFNNNETLGLMEIGKDFGFAEGKRLYQILMKDKNNKPKKVGKVVLGQEPDGNSKIQHLVNIEIDKKERGKGIGEYVVNMLSDYSDDAKGFAIKDIQKKALPFWKKLGLFDTTKIKDTIDGFVPNTSTNFRNAYKLPETQRRAQPDTLKELAKQLEEGKITKTKWDEEVKKLNPVSMFEEMPTVPSLKRIQSIVGNKANNKVIGKDISLESLDGKKVSNRLDIPSYDNYDTWVPTMHELGKAKGQPGKVIGYGQTAVLKNVDFHTPDMQRPIKMALKVAQGKSKSPFAGMEGTFKNTPVEEAYNKASEILEQIKRGESDYIQVGYNPQRASYFYDRATGLPVLNAEEVIQVGPLVLAKKPIMGKAADFKFEKGGYVHNYIEGL